ncbi:N4-gp56 family major capsid protein [uncultured Bartonella sp.]|uniref:N4-gp56 family major capsid protein n=1 Tax=uncultured Bartonella sp. TaxID=104108 RepID=UPI00261609DB|nr:N4-gp56 family major capsid protein [uncultured Bartonella sp.]
MAITTIGVNDPLAVRAWSKKLAVEVSKATEIAPLIGTDTNSIIQLKDETQKGAGDTVRFGLRTQLMGDGVSEGIKLEGNEEALSTLTDAVVINELAHAVRVKNEGSIDQQRVLFDLRSEAKDGLTDWYADRLSLMFFTHVCGYTAREMNFEGRTIAMSPVRYGFNEPTAPTDKRIIRPNGKTTDESLDDKDGFTLSLIDKAVERAKLANPRLRPVRVEGDNVYVLYLHPTQVTSLRTNTATGQWLDIQKAAYQGSRAKNPIFDGSLGMYNGVVLREAEHVTEGVNSADAAAPVENTRRAVLLGAQAGIIAFGKDRGPTRYKLVEELFDYERELGVAAKTLIGMKKTNFKLKNSTVGTQDFATIVISTYAEPV